MGIDIPGFIRAIRENEPNKALARIKEQSLFASICGRLCPAPCENACVFEPEGAPIGIRALERFASDQGGNRPTAVQPAKPTGKRIAIVGSGPAGIAAAAELAKNGYQVTVFDSLPLAGGNLRYGIPEYKFPKKILNQELNHLNALGVVIKTNSIIGKTQTLKEILDDGFAAVFLAVGSGTPQLLDIPGTNLGGVSYAEEFLLRVNLLGANRYPQFDSSPNIGKKVIVIGHGVAALDCARTVVRLGRQTTVVFSRTEDDLSVRADEKEYGKEEGVRFEPLATPLAILGNENNFVNGVKCIRMDFADTNLSGHWQLVPVKDSEFVLETDSVIIAEGGNANYLLKHIAPELKFNAQGHVLLNESSMTSVKGVFCQTKTGSVVEAIASGKRVAGEIDRYLKTNN